MPEARRPIKARDTRWAAKIAAVLAKAGVKPNQISILSAVFGLGAGLCLAGTSRSEAFLWPWLYLGAALFIQLRLLCNLFDGMVAIEGGFKTKSGEIYNELPDRFADAFIFIGAGNVVAEGEWAELAGWLCAVLAVLTAYVRALGVSAGASQHFCGPMAKQHRMALMTAACVVSAGLLFTGILLPVVPWALLVIAIGCVVTIFRRTGRIVRELESR